MIKLISHDIVLLKMNSKTAIIASCNYNLIMTGCAMGGALTTLPSQDCTRACNTRPVWLVRSYVFILV